MRVFRPKRSTRERHLLMKRGDTLAIKLEAHAEASEETKVQERARKDEETIHLPRRTLLSAVQSLLLPKPNHIISHYFVWRRS